MQDAEKGTDSPAMPSTLLMPPDMSRLRRIAVFRPRVLGDMLCALPTLRALKAAAPDSHLTLIGLPWAAELADRLGEVDDFIEFPGYPGLQESIPDLAALPDFLSHMQAQRFDLLIQLHDEGAIVNPLLAACGARHLAGFVGAGAFDPEPGLFIPWPTEGNEVDRLLRMTDHLGMPRQGESLHYPVNDTDRVELASLWPGAFGTQRFAVIHPGAQLPSRRWSPARFAEVADSLADQGCTIVLTGSAAETWVVAEVQEAMTATAVNLAGKTTLWTLGALIERASMLVCNDTGVSHVAVSFGTPSVIVSADTDAQRWAPPDHDRHLLVTRPGDLDDGVLTEPVPVEAVTAAAHTLLEREILEALEGWQDSDAVPTIEELLSTPVPMQDTNEIRI